MLVGNGKVHDSNAVLREKLRDMIEERNQSQARVIELESALTPIAEVHLKQWEQHQEPDAVVTIPMRLVQDAARALAGTVFPTRVPLKDAG